MYKLKSIICLLFLSIAGRTYSGYKLSSQILQCDVLVVGGGTSGIAAGIQSSRLGAKSIIVEQTGWLGGMLSSAGISATDGNHRLPSGLWQEFRNAIYAHYGGPEAVSTGWVSNTLFEPHVADSIFKAMAAKEKNLEVIYNYYFRQTLKQKNKVIGAIFSNCKNDTLQIFANVVIDATELGDVIKSAGAGYDVGMESKTYSGEEYAVQTSNDIIQDLTYAAILKDYGEGTDKTIMRPATYDSSLFICSCKRKECSETTSTCNEMLDYAKLPGNKYLINWPEYGNDIYLNAIEMNYEQREKAYEAAKEKTLCFVYYIQHSLGYKNLGLADDEFPTKDLLPFIPYNREGRKVKGLVRFTLNYILNPYSQSEKLYRTAISVGDYPVDHHSFENHKIPVRKFPSVPSFGIPLGCLIPANIDGLIVAEKGISVSNIVNGATRLQPCVLLTGQAAGILAAYCSKKQIDPKEACVRDIQKILLDCDAYLLPFIDVPPTDPAFKAIQRIGVTGIIKGVDVPYNWANQTWFYPEQLVSQYELVQGLKDYYVVFENYNDATGEMLTIDSFLKIISMVDKKFTVQQIKDDWTQFNLEKTFDEKINLNRKMVAVMIDFYLNPFEQQIDFFGKQKTN